MTEQYHIPRRFDAVETWLCTERDKHLGPAATMPSYTSPYWAINDLIRVYRKHADTGTPIDQELRDAAE